MSSKEVGLGWRAQTFKRLVCFFNLFSLFYKRGLLNIPAKLLVYHLMPHVLICIANSNIGNYFKAGFDVLND